MPLPRYTVRQIDAFLTVAETLSFTEASDRMGLTPSAVSQLIVELENEVGFKLFDRSTRKVSLSAAGKSFRSPAQLVMRHIRLAEVAAADLRSGSAGLVRIAAPMVIASAILPKLISSYRKLNTRVAVRIRDAAVEQMVDMVQSGEVDLAMGPDRSADATVARIGLFNSPWVLWCAPHHHLARKRKLRWHDLRGEELVTAGRDYESSIARMRIGVPESERIVPVDVVNNISTALGIAAVGLAATVSPAYVSVWAEPLGLVKRKIREPEIMREVSLYMPTRRSLSPVAASFARFVMDKYE